MEEYPVDLENMITQFSGVLLAPSRFKFLGELADINKAIEYQTQALLLTHDQHADKPSLLNNLGKSYGSRFGRLGEVEDLSRAIEHQTQAVNLIPDGHADRPSLLNDLGRSYDSRFGRLGELGDLRKAIEYQTQAVLLTPDDHSKSCLLGDLANTYQSQYECLGELEALNKAIEYTTQAMRLTPSGHACEPDQLNNLGNAYEARFRRLGELVDLNKAVEHLTQAERLTPEWHADKPAAVNNLGIAYHARFSRLGELADLNKAIEHQLQAVLLTSDEHADKPMWLTNLGISYEVRFWHLGELADLGEAIKCQTQAVVLTPDGHGLKPKLLAHLGNAYQSRFVRLGELPDINRVIKYNTQAVLLTPDGYASKPGWLYSLGNGYWFRFKRLGDLSDLKLTQSSYQRSAQLRITNPQVQTRRARAWAQCCLLLGHSPQSAYERCMELIPHYIWIGTTVDQRYNLLSEINNLATEAAAWAISIQAFDLALEWLEEGRTIVWNQILQLRSPFDDLFAVDPVLTRELKDTASKLEGVSSRQSASLSVNAPSDLEKDTQMHHRQASKWEQLLGKARSVPGFQNFLRPRKAKELMLSATDGPVDVKILHNIPISNLSLKKLNEVRGQLDSLIGERAFVDRGFKRLNPTTEPKDVFKSVLATCWSDVVQPVLGILACQHEAPVDELPHVTWRTTGALSFLPLHAAGLYDGLQPDAVDLIVSSYTPTLSALLTTGTPPTSANFGVLAVGQEHTRGLSPLPSTLNGSSATIDAVLGAMDQNSWVHLACHATQNMDNPAQSAFHLHDGPLTLETIAKRSFKNKGLAFLSACQTATGDEKLADEAIHLAAGMLIAGYPSVIATMWSIQDEDGPRIAEVVYADLLKDGKMDHGRAARALHKAVARLRGRVGGGAFKRWVPFTHIGA